MRSDSASTSPRSALMSRIAAPAARGAPAARHGRSGSRRCRCPGWAAPTTMHGLLRAQLARDARGVARCRPTANGPGRRRPAALTPKRRTRSAPTRVAAARVETPATRDRRAPVGAHDEVVRDRRVRGEAAPEAVVGDVGEARVASLAHAWPRSRRGPPMRIVPAGRHRQQPRDELRELRLAVARHARDAHDLARSWTSRSMPWMPGPRSRSSAQERTPGLDAAALGRWRQLAAHHQPRQLRAVASRARRATP